MKIIDKILNNYFTKKLLKEIKWDFIVRNLDYKFDFEKYRVWVKCKPKKYKDEEYTTIIHIDKDDSLKYLCDLDNFRTEINKIIIEYCKDINY